MIFELLMMVASATHHYYLVRSTLHELREGIPGTLRNCYDD